MPESQTEIDIELCKRLITQVLDPEKKIETFIIDAVDNLKS